MNRPETVYCVHKFAGGNADEISMNVGEQIVIIEKDDEYKDGWWKGRNEKGQVGLFPVTYTTTTPLPVEDEQSTLKTSGDSSVHKNSLGLSSKNTLSIVKQSLNSSAFHSKQVEEWDSEQVALWITDIGFDTTVADIFRDQEITGDILLELTVESLKELKIDTFGKRFKLHAAIKALRIQSIDTQSVSSPTSERKAESYYNQKQPVTEDDMVSNYSAVIRNSSLPSKHDTRFSLDSQQSSLSRHSSQGSYNDIFRSQATTPRSILPERRHTISNNIKEQKPSLPRSSSINKLHTVIPSTAMVRRSEDVPIAYEMPNTPDMEGWLFKQGDRYKNWNKRWFVLKGNNLFYFKSPKAIQMKGIINLKGYRVEVDSSIQAGKYCFKTRHDKERTFYFFTDQEKYMIDWVKAMMKATIERDFNTPVMSSSTIPTVSLETARRMRPRPPSTLFLQRSSSLHTTMPPMEEEFIPPFSQPDALTTIMTRSPPPTTMSHRAPSWLGQGTRITDNTSEFSLDYPQAKDDSGFNSYPTLRSPVQSLTHSSSSSSSSTATKNSACLPVHKSPSTQLHFYPDEEDDELIDPENANMIDTSRYQPPLINDRPSTRHFQPTPHHLHQHPYHSLETKTKEYLDWVNLYLTVKIDRLGDLSSGDTLLELLECLSNKDISPNTHPSSHTPIMDRMVTAFEYMHQEGIELEHNYTFRDILSGRESKILSLLDSIKAWYQISPGNTLSPFPQYSTNKKTASGGTFGEEEQNKLRALDDPECIAA